MINIRDDVSDLAARLGELAKEYTQKAKTQSSEGVTFATFGVVAGALAPALLALEPTALAGALAAPLAGVVVSLGVALAVWRLKRKIDDDFNSEFFKSAAESLSSKDLKKLQAELAAIEAGLAKLHIEEKERSEIESKVEIALKDLNQK